MPYAQTADRNRNQRRLMRLRRATARAAKANLEATQAVSHAYTLLQAMPEDARYLFIRDAGSRLERLFRDLKPAVRPRFALAVLNLAKQGDVEVLAALEDSAARAAVVKAYRVLPFVLFNVFAPVVNAQDACAEDKAARARIEARYGTPAVA